MRKRAECAGGWQARASAMAVQRASDRAPGHWASAQTPRPPPQPVGGPKGLRATCRARSQGDGPHCSGECEPSHTRGRTRNHPTSLTEMSIAQGFLVQIAIPPSPPASHIFLVYLENARRKRAFSPPNRHFFSENRTRRTGAIDRARRGPPVFLYWAHRQFGSLMLADMPCVRLEFPACPGGGQHCASVIHPLFADPRHQL